MHGYYQKLLYPVFRLAPGKKVKKSSHGWQPNRDKAETKARTNGKFTPGNVASGRREEKLLITCMQNQSPSLLLPHLSKQRHMWKTGRFTYTRCVPALPVPAMYGTPLQTLTVLHPSHMLLLKQMPSLPPDKREVFCWTDKLQSASSESLSLTSFVFCCQTHLPWFYFTNEALCMMKKIAGNFF